MRHPLPFDRNKEVFQRNFNLLAFKIIRALFKHASLLTKGKETFDIDDSVHMYEQTICSQYNEDIIHSLLRSQKFHSMFI